MEKKTAVVLYSAIIIVVVGVVLGGAVYYKDTLSDLFGLAVVNYLGVGDTLPATINFEPGENTATFLFEGREYTLVLGEGVVSIAPTVAACSSDADCARGYSCIKGTCQLPPEPVVEGVSRACLTDANCFAGETCLGGYCVTSTEPTKGGCTSYSECATEEYCRDGVCIIRTTQPPAGSTLCYTVDDCTISGEICYEGYCATFT